MSETTSRGYNTKTIHQLSLVSSDSLGVKLGKVCVAKNIPVTDVAEFFGVSRQAIYMWFKGKASPRKDLREKVERLVEKLSQQ